MNARPTLEQRLQARQRPIGRTHVMFQSWHDLLFLHWEFDAQLIQASLPPGLTVDSWNGKAYIGIVPFLMRNIRPRFLPAVPGISNFHEVNVRTYVYDKHGTPGVWFYSLDANQWLAVRLARSLFQLPYFDAKMGHQKSAAQPVQISYQTHRKGAEFTTQSNFSYRVGASLGAAEPGSFEFFLAERYILFACRKNGQLYSGQVIHTPYPLYSVDVQTQDTHLIDLAGFKAPVRQPEHALFSPGVDVDIFTINKVL